MYIYIKYYIKSLIKFVIIFFLLITFYILKSNNTMNCFIEKN